jgi:hypothetical protein
MDGGILFSAIVESLRSRKDKTIAITLGTSEVSPDKAGKLFNTNGHIVTCYLSIKEQITDSEKEIIDSIEAPPQGKSPSQRMRNTLFVLWQQKPEGYEDFNLFYLREMEKMIDHIKLKLTP